MKRGEKKRTTARPWFTTEVQKNQNRDEGDETKERWRSLRRDVPQALLVPYPSCAGRTQVVPFSSFIPFIPSIPVHSLFRSNHGAKATCTTPT